MLQNTHILAAAAAKKENTISTDLQEKFNALFPTWPTLVATILAIIVLLIVLTLMVYNPVRKMHDDRKNYIQNNIDEAVKQRKSALMDKEEANKNLITARLEAAEIISKAKVEAEEVKAVKLSSTENDAQKIIQDARKEIAFQQIKFKDESKQEIVELALAAAKSIIKKEVDSKTNRQIVEDFIKENQ